MQVHYLAFVKDCEINECFKFLDFYKKLGVLKNINSILNTLSLQDIHSHVYALKGYIDPYFEFCGMFTMCQAIMLNILHKFSLLLLIKRCDAFYPFCR